MLSTKLESHGYCGIDLHCELFESNVDSDGQMRYTTYGIRILDRDGDVLFSQADISVNKQAAERFIEICETCGVSAFHIADVLEDFLE